MRVTEREIEAAEAAVAAESETEIARIREQLAAEGKDVCVVCDEPIPAQRRAALPSASRCIGCQNEFDRSQRVRDRHL